MVAKDTHYQSAIKNRGCQNAHMENERALEQAVFAIMSDNMESFKHCIDDPQFGRCLADRVFRVTLG